MSTEELEACPLALSNFMFTSAPTPRAWADDHNYLMFCVKQDGDIPARHRDAPRGGRGAQRDTTQNTTHSGRYQPIRKTVCVQLKGC